MQNNYLTLWKYLHHYTAILFIAIFLSFNFAFAQEAYTGPYNGNEIFKTGDMVEATYAGTWTPAQVVGVNEKEGKYKIHFEGEKYCNGHVLDSELLKEYVRPRKKQPADLPADNPVDPVEPQPDPLPAGNVPATEISIGDQVWYTEGTVVWNDDGVVEAYDPIKRQYLIRTERGSGTIVPCFMVMKPGSLPDNSFFTGLWDVYINGAAYTTTNDNEQTQHISGGMKQAPLEIKTDGSYTWYTPGKKTIKGNWKPRKDVPGIVLLAGFDGLDWTLYQKTEGYATTAQTRDEIGFHHIETQTGYLIAYRIGPNQSCVLVDREF